MGKINNIYIVNHSHTDIGFTDFQDLCFRQHREFIDQAIDLCEATASYPVEARYRWTCEVTGMTERWFNEASPEQIARYIALQKQGAIDTAGMQYNLTPLLTIEQIIRSLYPVRRMRETWGVEISTGMQCDVNGISWIYADLLPAVGIDFLTMSVNPIRGGVPKPMPTGFWWESPTGQKLLTWNGYHYLFGRNIAKLGDWRFVEDSLGRELDKLENDERYPFDFMYCQATNPIRVDNGPPDPRMPDFVREWNSSGRTPHMQFTTPTAFGKLLREHWGEKLPTWRGDWLDHWSDGVASSAYETGMNRTTHELLHEAEALGSWALADGKKLWSVARADAIFENATLYDEHTWGAFASIDGPNDRWTKAQWNRKASFAYTASSEAHDLVARGTNALIDEIGERGPEGMFNLGDLDPLAAYPTPNADDVLVVNMLSWDREVIVDEPEIRGNAAPAGVLDCFFPRNIPWGGYKPETPLRRVAGRVPALGFTFLPVSRQPDHSELTAGSGAIGNRYYTITIDPVTGGLASFIDREGGHDFAGAYRGYRIGQYVYEWVDDPGQRGALLLGDFSAENFGHGYTDTKYIREAPTKVTVNEPVIEQGIVSISVDIEAKGIRGARCTYSLRSGEKALAIDWLLDKEHHTDVESVYVAFPFALGDPHFRADINGLPLTPEKDQLNETVRDWYPVNRWVDVSDGARGVTVASLDAPMVQMGGITTGLWAKHLDPEGPTLMSWALNNHWMVNFKASQGGQIPLRYRLTTHDGGCDDLAASRFGAEQATPVIAMRDVSPNDARTGQFATIAPGPVELIHLKPADWGEGIILRLQNITDSPAPASITFVAAMPTSAALTSPDEIDGESLPLEGRRLTVNVPAKTVQSVRVTF